MSKRLLLFVDSDSSCHVKVEGEEDGARHFSDFLAALHFVSSVADARKAEVVVYDATGKVALQGLQVTDRGAGRG